MCFDSSIGFFGVSLQSFLSRVVPLLKIMRIPSFWSSLLKISENPFSYGTLKDFSKSIGVVCVFFPHQFYIFGKCISERSCPQYLLECHLQWMYLSEIPVPHCDLWFLYKIYKSYALKISVLMEPVFVTIGTFDFQLMYVYVCMCVYINRENDKYANIQRSRIVPIPPLVIQARPVYTPMICNCITIIGNIYIWCIYF